MAGPPGAGKSTVTRAAARPARPGARAAGQGHGVRRVRRGDARRGRAVRRRARGRLVRRAHQGARVRRARRRHPGDPRPRLPGARDRPVHHGDPRRGALGANGSRSSAGRPSGWSGCAPTPPRCDAGCSPAARRATRASSPTSTPSSPACGPTTHPRCRTSPSTTATARPTSPRSSGTTFAEQVVHQERALAALGITRGHRSARSQGG